MCPSPREASATALADALGTSVTMCAHSVARPLAGAREESVGSRDRASRWNACGTHRWRPTTTAGRSQRRRLTSPVRSRPSMTSLRRCARCSLRGRGRPRSVGPWNPGGVSCREKNAGYGADLRNGNTPARGQSRVRGPDRELSPRQLLDDQLRASGAERPRGVAHISIVQPILEPAWGALSRRGSKAEASPVVPVRAPG